MLTFFFFWLVHHLLRLVNVNFLNKMWCELVLDGAERVRLCKLFALVDVFFSFVFAGCCCFPFKFFFLSYIVLFLDMRFFDACFIFSCINGWFSVLAVKLYALNCTYSLRKWDRTCWYEILDGEKQWSKGNWTRKTNKSNNKIRDSHERCMYPFL